MENENKTLPPAEDGSLPPAGENTGKESARDAAGNADAEKSAPAEGAGSAEGAAGGKGETPAQKEYSAEDLKKRKRKNTISLLVLLLIIGCVIYALWTLGNTIQKGDTATFYEVFGNMNWWYILAAFALFAVMFVMEALKFTVLGKCNGCSLGFRKDMKTALVGKYYECITPFSSGGQPMQIYHLYKEGVPSAKSASITMVKYGVHMLGFTVVAAVVMGLGVPRLGTLIDNAATLNTLLICGWIGFGINAFIPVFVTLVVFFPRPVAWVVNLFVKLLYKIKILKNSAKIEARVRRWMDDFAVISQFVYKKPLTFFVLFLLCLGEPIIELIFPYLVLVAMCGGDVMGMQGTEMLFAVMVLAMYATYGSTFIPTPGNSGALEVMFMAAFASLTESVVFWFVLMWRFIIYYTWIILGLGMNVTDMAGRIYRRRKEARKNAKTP